MPVFIGGKDVIIFGTATITNVATTLGTRTCSSIYIQNDPGNSDIVRVGDVNGQFVALGTGGDISIQISKMATVFVKSDSGSQRINWAITG